MNKPPPDPEYDAWLAKQVAESLADPRPNLSHEQVMKNAQAIIDAAKTKKTKEAAEYDKWFREQVEQALKVADDPNTDWVSHEDAKAHFAAKRAELIKRIKGD